MRHADVLLVDEATIRKSAELTDMAAAQPRMMNVTTAVSVPSPRPLPLRGTEVPEGEGDEVSLARHSC